MDSTWHTAWQGPDIVVLHDDAEVDRFKAADVQRVIFVQHGSGEHLGDLSYSVVELPDEFLLLPANTGFAGRVHFERLAFWAEKRCVYWAHESHAPLPGRLRRGLRLLKPSQPVFGRVPRAELGDTIARWTLTGPQTWDERKWQRIASSRPFATAVEAAKPRLHA